MAGVDDHGQMAQLMQLRHGGEIQRVAGIVTEGADAALAEDHPLVSGSHDILRAHQQLPERVGKAALEQNRLVELAQLAQQIIVLHAAGTHLQHVHILKKRELDGAHDLRDNGKPRLGPRELQQLDPALVQTGKIVGRGAGLEGAAAQQIGAGGLDRARYSEDLLLTFHRAGPGDHRKMATADLDASHLHDQVVGMKFAVAAPEGLGHALDGVNNVKAADQIRVHGRGIADQTENGMEFPLGDVDRQTLLAQPVDQLLFLFLLYTAFEYNDHVLFAPFVKKTARGAAHAA